MLVKSAVLIAGRDAYPTVDPVAHAIGMKANPCAMFVESVRSAGARDYQDRIARPRRRLVPPNMLFITPVFPLTIPTRLRL